MKRKRLIVTFSVLILVFLIATWFLPLNYYLALPLTIKENPKPADAIVVLSGGLTKKGDLGESTKERLNLGINLWKNDYGRYLLLSGGSFTKEPKDASVMAKDALKKGVPAEALLLESSSENTYENVLLTTNIYYQNRWHRILVVTSAYHTRRVKTMYTDRGVKVIVIYPEKELIEARGFLRLRQTFVILEEYLKLLYYFIGKV
ncbi:YdcF family protein [Carboxydothermus pertinax]|nr:YdcF family protein [Carboxydothermus pertinax]